ncbi:hypothetical protein GCM10009623_34610 [Nocardioides aestuarii]|uniref:Uncharacterized protein n=1 Tax=Nocardioides aestuarii TaxID=252231 RepID=A0ABW4TSK8_9ACTN
MDRATTLLPDDTIRLPPSTTDGDLDFGNRVPGALLDLLPGRRVAAMLRESGENGVGPVLAAARSTKTIARRIAKLDIHITAALPPPEALATCHRHANVTHHDRDDDQDPFTLRTTVVEMTGTPLVLLLMTGSAAQLDDDFDQPATRACAEFLTRFRPALSMAVELSRIGRDPWAMKDIVTTFRRIEKEYGIASWLCSNDDSRDWDPDALFLEPFSNTTEDRLFRAGRKGRAESLRFKSRVMGAIESELEPEIPMVGGRARDPGAGPVLPGFGQVHEVTERGLRGRPIMFADGAEGFPHPHEASGSLPRLVENGRELPYPDMLETLRWLFRTADTPGWTDLDKIGRELERRRFSHQGLRRIHGPTALFQASSHGTRKLLNLIMTRHLDDYHLRRTTRRRDGSEWLISDLPATISTADYRRLRERWPAPQIRDRPDTYLLTSTEVLVDDIEPGILQGRRRRSDNAIIYVVLTPDSSAHLGAHSRPVPPLPQAVYFSALFDALGRSGASLTPPPDDEPDELALLSAEVEVERQSLRQRRLAQQRRFRELDPGQQHQLDSTATRPDGLQIADSVERSTTSGTTLPPPAATDDGYIHDLREKYNSERQSLLTDEAQLRERQRQLETLQGQPRHPGLPVADLLLLAGAAANENDRQMRIPLHAATSDFRIYRRGAPTSPDDPSDPTPSFACTLTIHDPGVGTRQAQVRGTYPTRYQKETSAKVREILERLNDGVPLRSQAGTSRSDLPDLRRALGGRQALRVLGISDPRLLTMTMQCCHPLRPLVELDLTTPTEPMTLPPLDEEALGKLADDKGWPLALMRRIRTLHLEGTRTTSSWLYRSAPGTSTLYATGRRRRTGFHISQPLLLKTPRTRDDWYLDGRTATLLPCSWCGSRRIYSSRLMEAVGGICRACRRDRAGVRWPPAYDRFLE